jgi:prevent-host-death family protein
MQHRRHLGQGPLLDLDVVQGWSYPQGMISKNISSAKAELSALVNAALNGEDVTICKDGVPAVRLVPVRPVLGEDPCRFLPELSVQVDEDVMAPLGEEAWGAWVDDGSS